MIARMFVFESIMLECACHMSCHATRVHATRVASAKQKATVGPWTPTGEFIRHGMGPQNRKQPWVHGPPQESLLGMAWVVRLGTHARVRSTRFASAKQTTTVGPWTPKGPFIIIRAWHGSGGWERMQGKQPHQVCFSASSRVWEDEFTPHTWTCWLMYLHFFRDVKYDF